MDAPSKKFTLVPEMLASVMLGFALLSLVPVAVYGRSAFFTSTPKPPESSPEDPAPPPTVVLNPHRAEHVAYTLAGLIGAIVAITIAVWAMTNRDVLNTSERATRALKSLLAFGAFYGGTVMLFGLALFVLWFESISLWLDAGDTKEAYKVLIPVIIVVIGAAMMFLGMQPARAEERNNPTIRRLIYGTNLGLSALLLLFALLAVNILLALKLPARLDTTESGFYSLTDSTKNYLATLDAPITAITNVPNGGRAQSDIRRLLDAVQEANPARVQLKTLSNSQDGKEIDRLQTKYPQYNFNARGGWVLLVANEDDNRTAFLPANDFITTEGADQRGRGGKDLFVGESKLMREVLFLGANKVKPIVYYSQGHGELAFDAAAGGPGRMALALKGILEKNYVELRPWLADPKAPAIPDDATAVIVADPRTPFTPEEATAINVYMTKDFPEKRKGKLIVLTSPFARSDGKGVADTGLESVLLSYSITLGKGYLLSVPSPDLDPTQLVAWPDREAFARGNPVATLVAGKGEIFTNCRSLSVTPAEGPEASVIPETLLTTYPPNRFTWTDPDPPTDPAAQWKAITQNAQLMAKFRVSRGNVTLAAAASDGKTPRVIVFGSGAAFADAIGNNPSPPVSLIATGLDWLRDRPTLPIVNKPYQNFVLPQTADGFRLFWLPVGLVLIAVTVAGLGVWTVRRK